MQIEQLERTDSTNRELMQRLQAGGLASPAVIWTDRQTDGRGQRGRSWETQPGKALAFSAYFAHDALPVGQIYQLNKWVSLAVCSVLSADLPAANLKIKWPNDIVIDGRKIAGILIENLLSGRAVTGSVIGVGLNVNQTAFAGEYRRQPVSMQMLGGQDYDIGRLAESLASILSLSYDSVAGSEAGETLDAQYRERLYLHNESARFEVAHKPLAGRILDVDATGRIVIESEGRQQYFAHGEIEFKS